MLAGGGVNQHMENSICFVVFIFESFPNNLCLRKVKLLTEERKKMFQSSFLLLITCVPGEILAPLTFPSTYTMVKINFKRKHENLLGNGNGPQKSFKNGKRCSFSESKP